MPGPCQARGHLAQARPQEPFTKGSIAQWLVPGSAVQMPEFSKNPSLGASRWQWCLVSGNSENRAISSVKAGSFQKRGPCLVQREGEREDRSHRGWPGTADRCELRVGTGTCYSRLGFGVLWGLGGQLRVHTPGPGVQGPQGVGDPSSSSMLTPGLSESAFMFKACLLQAAFRSLPARKVFLSLP